MRLNKLYFVTMKSNIKTRICSFIAAISLSTTVYAQDIHFSQMYYSPLTLNPALAGIDAPISAAVNYRSQWRSIASPYSTIAASFDARLNEHKRRKKGIFAIGINFFNDQSGDTRISTTNANLHLAYHLILDRKSTLGAAIYTGYGQRAINTAAGRWGNQFDGLAYNPVLPSGEYFMSDSFGFIDVGTGFVYNRKQNEGYITSNRQKDITIGIAAYHLSRPNYSFLNTNDDRLYMRFSAFFKGTFGIENTLLSIVPAIYYQRQGKAQELLVGTYFRYMILEQSKITGFNKGTFLSLGAFYRNKDAMVVKAMLEFNDFSLGFGYDVNISSLTSVSNARGGFELFLKYGLTRGLAGNRSRI